MYHVSAQGVDERMINVHYYYYYYLLLLLLLFVRFGVRVFLPCFVRFFYYYYYFYYFFRGGGNFPCISVWPTLVNLICIIMGICAFYVFLLSCKAL